jgi:hypothetical protein
LPPEEKVEDIVLAEPMRLSALPAKPVIRMKKGRSRTRARHGKIVRSRRR